MHDRLTLPEFTIMELRCIHRDLRQMSWQPERFYDERRSVTKKLDVYFKDDETHLKGKNL